MKKDKRLLSKIVKCILSFSLIAVYLPNSSIVRDVNAVEQLGPNDKGRTLGTGIYELNNVTISSQNILNTEEVDGLAIRENSTVTLIITGDVKVLGGSTVDGNISGAGIRLPSSSILIIRGTGSLTVSGGSGTNGFGKKGESVTGYEHDLSEGALPVGHQGKGGLGGNGSAGGSAGIGGRGGRGGLSGQNGADGESCGTMFALGSVIINATGGKSAHINFNNLTMSYSSVNKGPSGSLKKDQVYAGGGGGGSGAGGGDAFGFGGGGVGGGGGQQGGNGSYDEEAYFNKLDANAGVGGSSATDFETNQNAPKGLYGRSFHDESNVDRPSSLNASTQEIGKFGFKGGNGGTLYASTDSSVMGIKGGGQGPAKGSETIIRTAYDMKQMKFSLDTSSYIYDGTAKLPTYSASGTVNDKTQTFTMDEVSPKSYQNNINAGTGSVTVHANEIIDVNAPYIVTGEDKILYFSINRANLDLSLAYSPPPPFTYGQGFTANLTGNKENGDVTWSAASGSADYGETANKNVVNVKPRTNSFSTRVRVAQTSNYNAADKTFKLETINKKTVNELNIAPIPSQKFTGSPITPIPVITDPSVYGESKVLTKGLDYQVTYNNNTIQGNSAEVRIQGIGMYTGERVVNFSIGKVPLSETTIAAPPSDVVYNGGAQISCPTLTYNGFTLVENIDYTVQQAGGKDNTNVSKGANHAGVTLVAKGNFSGERTIDFNITPDTINDLNTNVVITKQPKNVVFNGAVQTTSEPTISYRGKTLKKGEDYTLTYTGSTKEVGTAGITITGMNNFKDTRTTSYQITPANVTVTADANQGKIFGTQDPSALTYSFSGGFAHYTPVFTGTLERDAGEDLGNYRIKQGTLSFDTNNPINNNYTFTYTGSNFVISEFNAGGGVEATLEGTIGENDWYTDSVKIVAPSGYKISASNILTGNTWTNYITNVDGDYSKGASYFLKRDSDNAVTKAMSIAYKQDCKKPNGSIVIGTSLWSQFLQDITFNMFFNTEIKADVFGDDAMSGIDKISYVESENELTYAELDDIPDEYVVDEKLIWNDSNPAYLAKEKAIMYARIIDKAGHYVYVSTDGIILDKDKPEVTAIYEFDDEWTNQENVEITGSAKDILAGFKDRYLTYTRDGQKSQLINLEADGTFEIGFLPDGDYGVLIEGMDKAGNKSDDITLHVKKDTVKPQLSLIGDTVNIKKDQTISFDPMLGSSPVKMIEFYQVGSDGENGTWVEVEHAMVDGFIAEKNNIEYKFRLTNEAGSVSQPVSMTFTNIDAAKPVVNVWAYTGSSEDDLYTSGDWTNQEVQVNFMNKTANRGESTYEMKLDDGSFVAVPSTNGLASISINGEGKHNITLRITSKGGVESDEVNFQVNIDKSAPMVKVKVKDNITSQILSTLTFNEMFKKRQNVNISGSDIEVNGAKSEVNEITYFVYASQDNKKLINCPTTISDIEKAAKGKWEEGTSLTIDPNKTYVVYAKVNDHAGNIAYASSNGLLLDDKSPEIDIQYEANGKWTHDARIEGYVNDDLAGVRDLFYQVDDQEKLQSSLLNGDFQVGSFTDGKHRVKFEANDALGNLTFSDTIDVWQDNIVPTIDVDGTDELGESTEVSIDAKHTGASNLEKVEVKIGNGKWQDITDKNQGTYTVLQNGIYTFRATSGANVSKEKQLTFTKIFAEGITPVIEAQDSKGKEIKNNGWANNKVSVMMHNDPANVTGIDYLYRTSDSASWTQATNIVNGVVTIDVDSIGHHHYEFKMVLLDGSEESEIVTLDFDIEKTLPQGKISLESDTNSSWQNFLNIITFNKFYKEGQWFMVNGSDSESGLDDTSVQYFKRESSEHEKLDQDVVTASDIEDFVNGRWTEGSRGFMDLNHAYVIYAKIVDRAGNVLYLSSDGIIIDDTKPQINTSFDSGKWIINDTIPITVNVEETLSDFDFASGKVTYKINDVKKNVPALTNGTFDIAMSELVEGNNVITIDAQDKAENDADTYQNIARKDTNVPTLTVTPESLNEISAQNILTITPTVGASGVKKMEILYPGETTWRDITDDYEDGYPARLNGIYRVRLTNGAGVRANETVSLSNLDSMQPIISASAIDSIGAPYISGTWHQKDVTVSFSNLANNEGISTYAYRIGNDGNFTTIQPNAYGVASFDVTAEGANDVYLQITSRTGVTNEEYIFEVNKDISSPQLEVISMEVITNFQVITLNAVDDGVGLDLALPYSFDGGSTWTNQNSKEFEDNKIIKVAVRDALGNITKQDANVRLDNVAPYIDNAKQNIDDWATAKLVSADIQDVSDKQGVALISNVQRAFMTAKNPFKEGEITKVKPSNSDYVLTVEDDTKWITNQEITDLLGLSTGDNYWIVAVDNADNVSSTSLKVDKIFYETEEPDHPDNPDDPEGNPGKPDEKPGKPDEKPSKPDEKPSKPDEKPAKPGESESDDEENQDDTLEDVKKADGGNDDADDGSNETPSIEDVEKKINESTTVEEKVNVYVEYLTSYLESGTLTDNESAIIQSTIDELLTLKDEKTLKKVLDNLGESEIKDKNVLKLLDELESTKNDKEVKSNDLEQLVTYMIFPLIVAGILSVIVIFRSRKKYKEKEKEMNGGNNNE